VKLEYEDFRKHFATLSDEGLMGIDRDELVELAQQAYDEALTERGIPLEIKHVEQRVWVTDGTLEESAGDAGSFESPEADWLDNAYVAASWAMLPGVSHVEEAVDAQAALQDHGIPSELQERDPEEEGGQPVIELKVPGGMGLQAISILDVTIYNSLMVEDWKTHFHSLSDQELRAVDPALLVAGLLDRAQRLKQAYADELARRKA
jgi:hypothetical protein